MAWRDIDRKGRGRKSDGWMREGEVREENGMIERTVGGARRRDESMSTPSLLLLCPCILLRAGYSGVP